VSDPASNHLPRDPAPPPCPECGAPRSTTASPPPWPIRHRLLIQLLALALALGFWAYRMAETWPTLPAPTTWPPGITSADFPPERFTRADLEAYARGERRDGRLLDIFDLDVPDTAVGVEAALMSPTGYAQTAVSHYGWPYPVYSWRKSANYSDIYTLANPTTGAGGLIDTWIGWARVRVRIDENGLRERSSFYPERLVASALVVFATWIAARLIWLVIAKLCPAPLRSRRVRICIPLCIGAAAAVVVAVLSLREWTTSQPFRMPAAMPVTASTGLTFADIVAFRAVPDGEAQLATALLAAIDAAEAARTAPEAEPEIPSTEPVLVYAWRQDRQMESAHVSGGWPVGLNIVQTGVAAPHDGATTPKARRHRISADRNTISIVRHNPDEPAERLSVSYSLASLTKVAAALLVMWYTIAAALGLWRRLLRRRDRRRASAGRCVPCGYDLQGASAAGLLTPDA
jgi:hypothetical protein